MQPFDATLFIVDDSPESQESAVALAEVMRLRYEAFTSAEQFLACFDPPRTGCALVDFRLGGMNGIQLLRRLADLDRALPVILISAYADVRIAVRAVKNGAYSVIEKPCRFDELSETIRRAIEYSRRVQSAREQQTAVQTSLDQLDSREREVMAMVLDGLPNKAIVSRLDISPRTLNRIRASLLRKMDANSVVELAQRIAEIRTEDTCGMKADESARDGACFRLDGEGHGMAIHGMPLRGCHSDALSVS